MDIKSLYESAIQLINEIKSISLTIDKLKSEPDVRIKLRTDDRQREVNLYSHVRPSAYAQFLNGELKDLEKSLKVIESEIKRQIK